MVVSLNSWLESNIEEEEEEGLRAAWPRSLTVVSKSIFLGSSKPRSFPFCVSRLIDSGLVLKTRCRRVIYPESYIIKYTTDSEIQIRLPRERAHVLGSSNPRSFPFCVSGIKQASGFQAYGLAVLGQGDAKERGRTRASERARVEDILGELEPAELSLLWLRVQTGRSVSGA